LTNINFTNEREMSDLNDRDRQRLDNLEHKLDDYMRSNTAFMKGLDEKFDRWDALYYAFVGNKFDNKAGIMNRIVDLESDYKAIDTRVDKVEGNQTKIFAYSAAIAVLLSTLFNFGKFLIGVWTK
jgi:hypothetical protein